MTTIFRVNTEWGSKMASASYSYIRRHNHIFSFIDGYSMSVYAVAYWSRGWSGNWHVSLYGVSRTHRGYAIYDYDYIF